MNSSASTFGSPFAIRLCDCACDRISNRIRRLASRPKRLSARASSGDVIDSAMARRKAVNVETEAGI